ncbi:hypothetical protein ACFWN5_36930 [Streptomyces sp. NPDC058430]|uniref:hypothetical protein n=1 Tax=Streptomyces sp. NPDC058430 TaxID=3346495 RepID=UPI003649D505
MVEAQSAIRCCIERGNRYLRAGSCAAFALSAAILVEQLRADPADWKVMDTLPNPASDNTTRFESAPDGTLIPVPSEAPQGKPVRDDAQITVSARQERGYYVAIYNGTPDSPSEVNGFIDELFTEVGMKEIEDALIHGAPEIVGFLAAAAGLLASVLTTSPLLNEQFFRGTMEDGTQVTYAVLTPKN